MKKILFQPLLFLSALILDSMFAMIFSIVR